MTICPRCFRNRDVGQHGLYLCPLERQDRAPAVRPDTIVGGILIEHGICNDDGTPKRYDSQSDIDAACKARGYARWTDGYSEDRTRNARDQIEWQKSGEAQRKMRDNIERERETKR